MTNPPARSVAQARAALYEALLKCTGFTAGLHRNNSGEAFDVAVDGLILAVRADQQETIDRLTEKVADYQSSFHLCPVHQPEVWEDDGTCPICEAHELHKRAESADAQLASQVKALISELREQEIDGLKNAAYFDALHHVSEGLDALAPSLTGEQEKT